MQTLEHTYGHATVAYHGSKIAHERSACDSASLIEPTLARVCPDAIIIVDSEGRILEASERTRTLFQLESLVQCLGTRLSDWVAPRHRFQVSQVIARALRGEFVHDYECNGHRADGSEFLLALHLGLCADTAQAHRLTIILRDLAGDHHTARAAQERLALQESALEAASIAIAILDRHATILWVNSAFTCLTGYSREEAIGQNPRLLKSGKQSAEFYDNLWSTVLSGKAWHGEIVNRHKDGILYTEDMTIMPSLDPEGHAQHFIAIKQDISERKQLEKQYLRAQRLQGLGMLAGGIAHDLNNLLAPILMSIELLRGRLTDPEGAELIEMLARSSQRGADIVKQVLTFARGVQGERVSIQPRHLIKELVRLTSETFPRHIQIRTRLLPDLDQVIGDATQLQQVLLNLCVNARDSMPQGGELLLSAENAQLSGPLPGAQPEAKPGRYVRFRVSDTGSGMPASVVERVFEPFFTTKEVGNGTGLGLPTALGIVRSHGGFLRVFSEPNKGSTFEAFLPAAPRDRAGTKQPNAKRAMIHGAGELILVVDDEAGVRKISRDLLCRFGYEVCVASDGDEAIEFVRRHRARVKVVVTDLMMPRVNGLELTRTLKRLEPALEIVATSGLTNDPQTLATLQEMRRLGVRHFLTKPYSAETLLQHVHLALHPEKNGNLAKLNTRAPGTES